MTRTNEQSRKYYAAHRREICACRRKWYATHREEKRVLQRIYYTEHREELRERARKYRETHREELSERQRKYQKTHRDEDLARKRNYYLAHREEIEVRKKIYRAEHSDENVTIIARRRARKHDGGGSHTTEEWRTLLAVYGNKCLACGATNVKLTRDHVIPLKFGGSNSISNIQPLCVKCNCKKHATIKDYRPPKKEKT